MWGDWARYRLTVPSVDQEEKMHALKEDFSEMSMTAMNFWL